MNNNGKHNDRPMFDASASDRDYCVMEDYVDPSKDIDSAEYWTAAKRPKALAALRRAFPQPE